MEEVELRESGEKRLSICAFALPRWPSKKGCSASNAVWLCCCQCNAKSRRKGASDESDDGARWAAKRQSQKSIQKSICFLAYSPSSLLSSPDRSKARDTSI